MRTYLQDINGGLNGITGRFSVEGILNFPQRKILVRMTNMRENGLAMVLYFSAIDGAKKLNPLFTYSLDATERPPRGRVDVSRFYRDTKAKAILGDEFYVQLVVNELYHQSLITSSTDYNKEGWSDS